MDNNTNTNSNNNIDFDRIFGTAGKVIDTSKSVYDAISAGMRDDSSRRNIGAGYGNGYNPYGQPSQIPAYGYGYYDDAPTSFGMYGQQPIMNQQMMSDFYPGISNPAYGKGGY